MLDALTGEAEPFERPPPGNSGYGPNQVQPIATQVRNMENQQAVKDLLEVQFRHQELGRPSASDKRS